MHPVTPEAPVLGGRSSRDDLGDEDGRVISDVRIIGSSCDAKAQTRVPLKHTHGHIRTQNNMDACL